MCDTVHSLGAVPMFCQRVWLEHLSILDLACVSDHCNRLWTCVPATTSHKVSSSVGKDIGPFCSGSCVHHHSNSTGSEHFLGEMTDRSTSEANELKSSNAGLPYQAVEQKKILMWQCIFLYPPPWQKV